LWFLQPNQTISEHQKNETRLRKIRAGFFVSHGILDFGFAA
jgi:hypothetical protein